MISFVKYTVALPLCFLLLGACSNERIEYVGDTVATKDQKDIITLTVSGLFLKDFRCTSISKIVISKLPSSPSNNKSDMESWEAIGCGERQRYSVEIYKGSNVLKIDPVAQLLPNNSFNPNPLRSTNNMAG